MQGLERAGSNQSSRLPVEDTTGPGWRRTACSEPGRPPCEPAAGPLGRRDACVLCDGVIDLMAALFSVSGRQLRSPKRHGRSVARVRQIGMYIAHTSLGLRMAEVAAGFGRDKSTVMYACHLVEDLRDDVDFDGIVARAEQIVRVAFNLQTVREGGDER